MTPRIHYGKADVKVYRTYGRPLNGVTRIPESDFTGRSNTLMAAELAVDVRGDVFIAAYTEGDNRLVVATDTMKNFIHAASLEFDGATLEAWLFWVGRRFLETYPHMERLGMTGRELPFPAVRGSDRLFSRDRNDAGTAWLDLARDGDRVVVTDHGAGRADLLLIKITGSAFADFARDEHTTLPERRDRPLYVHMDVGWRYANAADAIGADGSRYVASEQIADLCGAVFDDFVSLSIQHLVHEIGGRILERFPQLSEVSFEAQNRLWDLVATSGSDERVKSYADPRPPYGRIGLVLPRD
jgi:urate oxidase